MGNFRYKKDLLDAIIAHICSSGSIVVQRKGTKQGNTTAFKTMDNGGKITSDSSSTLSESDESEDLVLAKFDSSDEESNSLESGNEISVKRAAAVHLFQVKSWDLYQSLGKISNNPGEEQSEDLPNTLNFSNFYDSGQMDKVSFHYKILPFFSVCSKHMSVVRKITVFEYQDLENKIHSF